MTTAARPTWAPAKGGNEQGGTRIFGPSQKYSSRDIASHTTLKPKKDGKDTQEEPQKRNLQEELEDHERRHFSSKDKYSYDRDRSRRGSQLLLERQDNKRMMDSSTKEIEDKPSKGKRRKGFEVKKSVEQGQMVYYNALGYQSSIHNTTVNVHK
ncbi:hypothetical protein ABKV19_008377 [Rosa sericea]